MQFATADALLAALEHLGSSPLDGGRLDLIVRRPDLGLRDEPDSAELDRHVGVVGDNWLARGSRHTPDGSAEGGRQITIMNSRAADVFACGDRTRWSLAGDQLYLDLLLSDENLPAGSRLQLGSAVVEVTDLPHTGCAKFKERFGLDASRFVNSVDGRRLHLRGINARVVQPGTVRVGDLATKR